MLGPNNKTKHMKELELKLKKNSPIKQEFFFSCPINAATSCSILHSHMYQTQSHFADVGITLVRTKGKAGVFGESV